MADNVQKIVPIVYLCGDVTPANVGTAIKEIVAYQYSEENYENIKLVLDTFGGSIYSMFSLYDIIKASETPIHTIGIGKVMSAGVLLLSAGEKGKRTIGKHTKIMIHPISSFHYGKIFELENEMAETKRQQQMMEKCLLAETKLNKEQIKEIMNAPVDKFYTANEAIDMGIADILLG